MNKQQRYRAFLSIVGLVIGLSGFLAGQTGRYELREINMPVHYFYSMSIMDEVHVLEKESILVIFDNETGDVYELSQFILNKNEETQFVYSKNKIEWNKLKTVSAIFEQFSYSIGVPEGFIIFRIDSIDGFSLFKRPTEDSTFIAK